MVVGSLVLLGLAVFLGRREGRGSARSARPCWPGWRSWSRTRSSSACFRRSATRNANLAQVHQFGYAKAATETPQPIVNILSRPLTFGGKTYAPGQVVYPGFDADVLWKFRWYSVINQVLVWTVLALGFGALLDRLDRPRRSRPGGFVGRRSWRSRPGQPAGQASGGRVRNR